MQPIRTLTLALVATVVCGCASQRTASPNVATKRAIAAEHRADDAILQAQAAMREADHAAQLAAGIDAIAPGTPRMTDAEKYRRTSASLRHQAISYADLAAKASTIAANVDDPAEQKHWNDTAADCAARSKALYKLSDHHAKLARKAK